MAETHHDEPTLSELLSDLRDDLVTLTRQQAALAWAEARQKLRTLAMHSGLVIAGAILLVLAAGFAAAAACAGFYASLVWAGLSPTTAGWVSPLTFALGLGGAAATMIVIGVRRLRRFQPAPEQTMQTLKEHARWITGKPQ